MTDQQRGDIGKAIGRARAGAREGMAIATIMQALLGLNGPLARADLAAGARQRITPARIERRQAFPRKPFHPSSH